MKKYVLLVACPDQCGLISNGTKVLADNGLNIIDQHETVEKQSGIFFMRTVFEGDIDDSLQQKLKAVFKGASTFELKEKVLPKVVVMASKEYHCLGDLLLKHKFNDLGAEILSVVSNHDTLKGLVERFDLPFVHIPVKGKKRDEHEKEVIKTLKSYDYDYIITAKYMRIFSPEFVGHFANKIINIHHSFLPAFIGHDPYQQAFDKGVKLMGATAHFINEELDQGPIITQKVMPIEQEWSIDQMIYQGRQAEVVALSKALEKVFDERVIVVKNKTIIF
jgi:formyltetrahydrofolate deformylase